MLTSQYTHRWFQSLWTSCPLLPSSPAPLPVTSSGLASTGFCFFLPSLCLRIQGSLVISWRALPLPNKLNRAPGRIFQTSEVKDTSSVLSHLTIFSTRGPHTNRQMRRIELRTNVWEVWGPTAAFLILESSNNVHFLQLDSLTVMNYLCGVRSQPFAILLQILHPSTLSYNTCVHWWLTLGTGSQFLRGSSTSK